MIPTTHIKENILNNDHKYSLTVCLLLAFGITWLGWIPGLIIGSQQGYLMPNFDTYADLFETGYPNTSHIWLVIAFQLGVYGPLIGGLVATWMDGGKEGLSDLWQRISRWKFGGRWYLAAFAIPFVITATPPQWGYFSWRVVSGSVRCPLPMCCSYSRHNC